MPALALFLLGCTVHHYHHYLSDDSQRAPSAREVTGTAPAVATQIVNGTVVAEGTGREVDDSSTPALLPTWFDSPLPSELASRWRPVEGPREEMPPEKEEVLAPAAGSAPVAPAALPAWGPSLDWSPHKPGLLVESDCFVNADIALVFPHLSSLLTAPVRLGESGLVRTVALGSAGLNPTVSPLIQIGAFRFGPGYAELAFSYRFLATEGNDLIPSFDESGPGVIRSRLNLQTFSLDYIRNDYPLAWDAILSWEVGARLQVVFFDTQVQTAGSFQEARNYFFGAGPHAGITVTRPMRGGLRLFGHFDAGMLGGYNTAQNFVVSMQVPQNGVLSGSASQQESQFAPSLAVQAGLSWTPMWLPSSLLRGGYQFEQWYHLGRVEESRGDLSAHGVFVSWQYSF